MPWRLATELMGVEHRAEENPWEFTSSGRAEGESLDEFLSEVIFPSFFFLSGGNPPPNPCARHALLCP